MLGVPGVCRGGEGGEGLRENSAELFVLGDFQSGVEGPGWRAAGCHRRSAVHQHPDGV